MAQASKIEWVESVSSYVSMPMSYDAEAITAEDVANDGALRTVSSDAVLLSSTKGECIGTIAEVCRWQAETQGAHVRVEASGVTVDVDDVEFGAPDDDEAVTRRIAQELEGLRVVTAPHIVGEDADAGLVHDVIDPRTGTLRVGWDSGVATTCDITSLRAE